ncbi:aspartyl-phosphate phosphatase Spo0E family protein [Alkaliphilus sp. MSJ-5]|uniref:Aspartyl-phosphate phosphatase Spo0E family protein n=1 Tax=Alkaliphilus flagellatus TaxID=2841507 RepID=A0ABS6G467_9FIRM|nr:aspartyl-phosphate phosphatase Spo0E family protein [Alkaliphilus flagellatus]MBU5677286.1 aspartyl-phosphate phosphatase Spo0E family protein [Alkaliphilus flagellatus]
MLKNEIERLQGMLNEMILNKVDNSLIYDLSTQLDELIVSYYRQIKLTSN